MKHSNRTWHKKGKLHGFLKGKLCFSDLLNVFDNQKEDQQFFNKLPGFVEKCALTRGLKEVEVSHLSHLFTQTNKQSVMQSWSTGQDGI